MIFYFHPSAKSAMAIFRTVTILPETVVRVDEVWVGVNERLRLARRFSGWMAHSRKQPCRRRVGRLQRSKGGSDGAHDSRRADP
jgi:hypothetical protein